MANVADLTDDNFEAEVIKATGPVLVDFWATWCAPCRQMAPVLHELADENSGSAKVAKLDVDNNQEAAMKFGVSALPTFIIFKDGEPVERFVGGQSKSKLQEALDAAKA